MFCQTPENLQIPCSLTSSAPLITPRRSAWMAFPGPPRQDQHVLPYGSALLCRSGTTRVLLCPYFRGASFRALRRVCCSSLVACLGQRTSKSDVCSRAASMDYAMDFDQPPILHIFEAAIFFFKFIGRTQDLSEKLFVAPFFRGGSGFLLCVLLATCQYPTSYYAPGKWALHTRYDNRASQFCMFNSG